MGAASYVVHRCRAAVRYRDNGTSLPDQVRASCGVDVRTLALLQRESPSIINFEEAYALVG